MVSTMTARPKAPIALSGPTCAKRVDQLLQNPLERGPARIAKIESGLNPDESWSRSAMITRRSRAGSRHGARGAPPAS